MINVRIILRKNQKNTDKNEKFNIVQEAIITSDLSNIQTATTYLITFKG